MAEATRRRPRLVVAAVVVAVVALAWAYTYDLEAHAKTAPAVAAEWVAPVVAPIVSGFRTAARPTHQGVDLGAARNTPIHAASAGTVVRVTCSTTPADYGCDRDGGWDIGGCGWYVDLAHDGGIYTRYCHMGQRPEVTVGQTVATGDVLGIVGSTGNSSGPHLHFEVHLGGEDGAATAVDPVAFMAEHNAPIGVGA